MNWEYKVSNAPTTPRELQTILDREGTEQWELVSTTLIASRLLLLFKRSFEYAEQAEGVEAAAEGSSYPEAESELTEEAAAFPETGEQPAS